jgi:hypothetical protein
VNNGAVTLIYDGDGNCLGKTVGGATTQYLAAYVPLVMRGCIVALRQHDAAVWRTLAGIGERPLLAGQRSVAQNGRRAKSSRKAESRSDFVDLPGVAMGMNRRQQQSFMAVHGAQKRMRRQPGAKIFGTVLDEADGLGPAVQEVPERIRQRGKTPCRAHGFR